MSAVTLGKDGAFYVDIAQTFLDQGISPAFQRFNWPWFSLLIGSVHMISGIPLETCAYLLCVLLMAGSCALLVDCVAQREPSAAYWAVLVVLAMPAFNTFRGDIIREHGFWFFSVLALWLALRWDRRGGWWLAGAIQVAIAAAALFRLEALILSAALNLWLVPKLNSRAGWLRLLQLNGLPAMAALLISLAVLSGSLSFQGRVARYLSQMDPRQVVESFEAMSGQFADTLRRKYSKDDAGQIIFFGLLAVILIKFIKMLGPFCLVFWGRGSWSRVGDKLKLFLPFAWAWAIYLLVLMVFFVHAQFINSRYTSYLNLLAVPLVALVVTDFAKNFPRMSKLVLVLALLVMLDNVISLGAKKTHYIEAGQWLAANFERTEAIYYDDPRIGYYAGWGYPRVRNSREKAMSIERADKYRYFVIEAEGDELWLQRFLERRQLHILVQFANRKGDKVLVIGE